MKTSTILVLTGAVIFTLTTGCRHPQPKVTVFPNPAAPGGDTSKPSGPGDATPFPSVPHGSTGGAVASTDLPNEDKLKDRDLDRAAFAAQTVYFEYDRATVQAAEASKLDQVAGAFKAKGADYDLLIEGHCDERGTEEYNRALGERRALAIRELLIKSGVDGSHVFTRSFGKDTPANVSHDETAWSRNRRGEFVLVLPKKITTTQNTQ